MHISFCRDTGIQSVLYKITASALFWRVAVCHASRTAQLPVRDSLKSASGKQILWLNLGLHLEVAVERLGFKIVSAGLVPGFIRIPYLRAFAGELQQVIRFHKQTVFHIQCYKYLSQAAKHILSDYFVSLSVVIFSGLYIQQ